MAQACSGSTPPAAWALLAAVVGPDTVGRLVGRSTQRRGRSAPQPQARATEPVVIPALLIALGLSDAPPAEPEPTGSFWPWWGRSVRALSRRQAGTPLRRRTFRRDRRAVARRRSHLRQLENPLSDRDPTDVPSKPWTYGCARRRAPPPACATLASTWCPWRTTTATISPRVAWTRHRQSAPGRARAGRHGQRRRPARPGDARRAGNPRAPVRRHDLRQPQARARRPARAHPLAQLEGDLAARIAELRQREPAAVIIVSLHWASREGSRATSPPHRHALVDAGANVIAGHHTHVVNPVESTAGGHLLLARQPALRTCRGRDTACGRRAVALAAAARVGTSMQCFCIRCGGRRLRRAGTGADGRGTDAVRPDPAGSARSSRHAVRRRRGDCEWRRPEASPAGP